MNNNINLIQKIKTDLKIIILHSSDSNDYLSNLLEHETIVYNKIRHTLERNDLTLEEKQQELEKLSFPSHQITNYLMISQFQMILKKL